MELLRGKTLAVVLADGPLPVPAAVRFLGRKSRTRSPVRTPRASSIAI